MLWQSFLGIWQVKNFSQLRCAFEVGNNCNWLVKYLPYRVSENLVSDKLHSSLHDWARFLLLLALIRNSDDSHTGCKVAGKFILITLYFAQFCTSAKFSIPALFFMTIQTRLLLSVQLKYKSTTTNRTLQANGFKNLLNYYLVIKTSYRLSKKLLLKIKRCRCLVSFQ